MENNYLFWEEYNSKLKEEIKKICNEKSELYIDLHIHSNYSADGKQTVNEIIESTNKQGFDIIAITDHDSLDAYNEVYNYVKEGITKPLIIPGIEFTMDNVEYGNQCHLLQLFVNPEDDIIKKDVEKNYQAMFNRSKIQFKRLNDNNAINEIIKKCDIDISYEEYISYLNKHKLVPEYDTLCSYLMDKFKRKKITNFDILELLIKYNDEDIYEDRKEYKTKRYNVLIGKYPKIEENLYNTRFLLSMLAVREVDDDWWSLPRSGSLSVNSYGQLKVLELNNKYPIYFAHPTESKLSVVEKIIDSKKNIVGLEKNVRNEYNDMSNFDKLLLKKDLIKIIGSDSHDNSLKLYTDMSFYKIDSGLFKKIL